MEKDKYKVDFYKNTGSIPKLKGFRFEDPLQTAFKLSPDRAIE